MTGSPTSTDEPPLEMYRAKKTNRTLFWRVIDIKIPSRLPGSYIAPS